MGHLKRNLTRFMLYFVLAMALMPVSVFASRDSTSTDTTVVAPFSQGSKTRKVLLVRAGGWISAIGRVEVDTLKSRSGATIVLQGNFTDAAGTQQNFSHVQIDSLSSDSLTVTGNGVVTGNFAIQGGTTIGNASGDALTFHPNAWTLTNAVTITGTWTNLGTVTTVDINGGTLDGVIVGGASAAAGTFTTLTATGAFTSLGIDDNANAISITINSDEQVGINDTDPSNADKLSVYSNVAHSVPMIDLHSDNASATGGGVKIRYDGSGNIFSLDSGGTEKFAVTADSSIARNDISISKRIVGSIVSFTNLGTTPQDVFTDFESTQTGVYLINLRNADGDNCSFLLGFGLEAGVAISLHTVPIANCSGASGAIAYTSGDGRTYTFARDGGTGRLTIAASSTATGTTSVRVVRFGNTY